MSGVRSKGHLAVLSGVSLLLIYAATVWASVELTRRDVRTDGPVFLLPGGPAIPIAATAVVLWLLAQATWQEWRSIGVMVVIATSFYLLRRTRRTVVSS